MASRSAGLSGSCARTAFVHPHTITPNLPDRNFESVAPDAVRLADISCIPTDEVWLYLADVKDLTTTEIAGWSMSERLKSVLYEDTLKMAIRHSDRGVQYSCGEYRKLLRLRELQGELP